MKFWSIIVYIYLFRRTCALRASGAHTAPLRGKMIFNLRMADTGNPSVVLEMGKGDEEWLEVLRMHRKSGAPRRVLEEVQSRSEKGDMSQSMLIKAFRTLERMNRDDFLMKIVPVWQDIAKEKGVDFGTAFVLVNACCKRQELDAAYEICRICGLNFDKYRIYYDHEKLEDDQARSLLVELIQGHQANDDFTAALALLVQMQRCETVWNLPEENSRQILKRFLKGTAQSPIIRKALRSLLLMGGLKDKEGLQLLTNMFALSIRFIKGAISMDTLPVIVNTDSAVPSLSSTTDTDSKEGGNGRTEYVEVAFIGRSNVGKSSLINMMTNRKGLAYTSKTPGKTAEFNYFELRSRYNDLVDTWFSSGRSSDTFGGKYNAKKNDWNNNGPSPHRGVSAPTRSATATLANGAKKRGSAGRRISGSPAGAAGATATSDAEEKKKNLKLRSLSEEAASQVNQKIFFVDLPGLGYAERTRSLKERWLGLLGEYISGRSSLRVLLHLVDSRHGLLDVDKECLMLLETLPQHVTYVVVMTKVDKTRDAAVRGIIEKIRHEVDARVANGSNGNGNGNGHSYIGGKRKVPIVCTSSEAGQGGARLWAVILDAINRGNSGSSGNSTGTGTIDVFDDPMDLSQTSPFS